MQATYKKLLDKSISAAVSSIEIYNKPDFKYREESFVILIVNAWELLLKAKLLKDSGKLSALYVHSGRRVKRSRTGNPFTIDILSAMRAVALDPAFAENLTALIDIRDTSVHFFSSDPIRYLVYSLGVAALQNYQRLVKQWFQRGLIEYNFYIMPLAFAHRFKTLKLLELEKSPIEIANLVRSVAGTQASLLTSDFYFACEIGTELRSAKKFTTPSDMTVKIDPQSADSPVVIVQNKSKLDQYPLSYTEVVERVKQKLPHAKQAAINAVLTPLKLKGDETMCAFSFRTKAQEEVYRATKVRPKSATTIYKEDVVRFIVEQLQEDAEAK